MIFEIAGSLLLVLMLGGGAAYEWATSRGWKAKRYQLGKAPAEPLPPGWERWSGARPEVRGAPQNSILAVSGLDKHSPMVRGVLLDVAEALGIPVDTLAIVIAHESGWKADAGTTAKGLIQLTLGAKLPGYLTQSAIASIGAMSAENQLRTIALPYFQRFGQKLKGANPGDGLLANFLPSFLGKPESTVLASQGDAVYAANAGMAGVAGGDKSAITIADVYAGATKVAQQVGGRRIAVDGRMVEGAKVAPAPMAQASPSAAPAKRPPAATAHPSGTKALPSAPTGPTKPAGESTTFPPGASVEAQSAIDHNFYPAKVVSFDPQAGYTIAWADDNTQQVVASSAVKAPSAGTVIAATLAFQPGEMVEAQDTNGEWYPATVVASTANGYEVAWQNDGQHATVAASQVRAASGTAPATSAGQPGGQPSTTDGQQFSAQPSTDGQQFSAQPSTDGQQFSAANQGSTETRTLEAVQQEAPDASAAEDALTVAGVPGQPSTRPGAMPPKADSRPPGYGPWVPGSTGVIGSQEGTVDAMGYWAPAAKEAPAVVPPSLEPAPSDDASSVVSVHGTSARGLLLAAVQAGTHEPPVWQRLEVPALGVAVLVLHSPLRCAVDGRMLALGLSYNELVQVCRVLADGVGAGGGALPPTAEIVDAAWQLAKAQGHVLAPTGLVQSASDFALMDSVAFATKHNDNNERQIGKFEPDAFCRDHGKDWMLDPSMVLTLDANGKPRGVAEYGWRQPSGTPIQGMGPGGHDVSYMDYSMVCANIVQTTAWRLDTGDTVSLLDIYASLPAFRNTPLLLEELDKFR